MGLRVSERVAGEVRSFYRRSITGSAVARWSRCAVRRPTAHRRPRGTRSAVQRAPQSAGRLWCGRGAVTGRGTLVVGLAGRASRRETTDCVMWLMAEFAGDPSCSSHSSITGEPTDCHPICPPLPAERLRLGLPEVLQERRLRDVELDREFAGGDGTRPLVVPGVLASSYTSRWRSERSSVGRRFTGSASGPPMPGGIYYRYDRPRGDASRPKPSD